MLSGFHNQDALESQAITQEEAAGVVKLWADEQRSAPALPGATTIGDVAEGLDITPARAYELLREVRSKKAALQELPATFPSSPAASPLTILSILAVSMLVVSLLFVGGGLIMMIAGLMLLISLLASRRWGYAAIAAVVFFGLISYAFLARSADRPAAVVAPTSEAPAPPPNPPMPAPPPLPR